MKRREFILLFSGAFAFSSLGAKGQSVAPVIGFLGPGSANTYEPFLKAFQRGLGEGGFSEDRIRVEYRWAENRFDQLPALAEELVRRPVRVLVTASATAAAIAAKNATETIPVVFAIGADPVKYGLVTSLNRPGGNVTGVSFLSNTLVAKQVDLLQELVPNARIIGVLANPKNPNASSDKAEIDQAAKSRGLQVRFIDVGSEGEFDAAFASLTAEKANALLVLPDAQFGSGREKLAMLTQRHSLPTIFSGSSFVEAGGLASYGTDLKDAYRQIGLYTARILKGEKPSDLPVLQPTKFEFVINLKTANALGLTIPPTLLASVDQVIE
jgi:putative tryptophan/tyrosine transport system substrate-binding protein